MLDKVKLILHMKFQKFNDWMQRYGQKHQKYPQNGFSPICDPQRFFFKTWALSLLYTYGALTSCKKLEKTMSGLQDI